MLSKSIKTAVKHLLQSSGYEIHQSSRKGNIPYQPFTQDSQKLAQFTDRLNQQTVKLHFGCGPRILKGWINIDLYYVHFKDYLKYYAESHYPAAIRGNESDFFSFDVTTASLPIPDNSVDVIFHEDFIEHLDQRGQFLFLAETFRILKPGGFHRINTPNLVASMRSYSDFSKGFHGVYVEEWDKHKHFSVLTEGMLEEMAKLVGYERIIFNGKNQSQCKFLPLEYRPDPRDRPEEGNLFADLQK